MVPPRRAAPGRRGAPGLCGARAGQSGGTAGGAPGFPRVRVKSRKRLAGRVLEGRLRSARGPSEISHFFGIFLVKLGDELVAASHCLPALLLLGHTGVLGVQVLWERKLAFLGKGLDYDKAQTKSKTNKEIK